MPRSSDRAQRESARHRPRVEAVEPRIVPSGPAGPLAAPAPVAGPAELAISAAPVSVATRPAVSAAMHAVASSSTLGDTAALDLDSGSVGFTLTRPAAVSGGVFDARGHLVRTLFSMQPMGAGAQTVRWDGTDDLGAAAPPGDYSIRLVVNRGTATNVGAIGSSAADPSTAQHVPTSILSVAVDASGAIYTANSWDEPGADFKKWTPDGRSVYDARFQIRNGDPNGAPYRVATDGTYMYLSVGAWSGQQQVQRFRLADGTPAPFTGTGLAAGHIEVYPSVAGLVAPGTPPADVEVVTNPLQSLAVSGDVLLVADAAGGRVLRYDKDTGLLLGQFPVLLPQALAVDAAGRIWVGHEHGAVGVYSPDGRKLADALSGLGDIVALAFGPGDRLYVADRGAGQVKVYQASGVRAQPSWTLGEPARPGDRASDRFYALRGVAVDPGGNIVTVQTEPAGGARIARWAPDGSLLWEQFGNEFVSLGNYGQRDPDQFYSMTFHRYALTDPETGSWTYLGNTFPGGPGFSSNPHGVPRVLTFGGVDFFFMPTGDGMQVYRIDGGAFHLATLVGGQDPAPDGSLRTAPPGEWTWSDASGRGRPAPGEIRWYRPPGQGSYRTLGMNVDRQGNIVFADQATGGIWEIPLGPLDAKGNPTYDWSTARQLVARDVGPLGFQVQMVQRADDGSLYAFGWSTPWPSAGTELWMGGTTLVKLDAAGTRQWAVRLPETCTGMDTIPGTGGVMIGGGKSTTIYQYNADGLRVGSMSPGAALAGLSGWLDNQASVAVSRNPRDGLLDVFTEDDYGLHIGWYRVDDRTTATLTVSLTPGAPAPAPILAPAPAAGPQPPALPGPDPATTATREGASPTPAPSIEEVQPRAGTDAVRARIDARAPRRLSRLPVPATPVLVPADDTGVKGDGVTAARRPRLYGRTVRGGIVDLLDGAGHILGTSTASRVDGSFSVQPTRNLAIGAVRLRFRFRDAAGDRGPAGSALSLTIVKGKIAARNRAAAAVATRRSLVHGPHRNANPLIAARWDALAARRPDAHRLGN